MSILNRLRKREPLVLGIIILIGLIHGIVYIFLMPPWQHYDEPTHFEYAWMIAHQPEWPVPGEYDWEFRADMVRSMIRNGFYDGNGLPVPDPDNLQGVIAGLQFPQLGAPPLYYVVVKPVLLALQGASLENQLYALRFYSLTLYLITIAAAWAFAREITEVHAPLRFLMPLTIALIPGFADLMTAFNNDVGAIALFSVFLWLGVRAIQKGLSVRNFIALGLVTLAAAFTKSTSYYAVPLLALVLVIGLAQGRFRKWIYGVCALFLLLGVFLVIDVQEPAYWYRTSRQNGPMRMESEKAVHGDYVFVLDPTSLTTPVWLGPLHAPIQPLNDIRVTGRQLTFGAWMWYQGGPDGKPVYEVSSPVIYSFPGDAKFSRKLTLTPEPVFHVFELAVPDTAWRTYLSLPKNIGNLPDGVTVYYDGFVLADGSYPADAPPVFDDAEARSGQWGGRTFVNLLRNGSAEDGWISLHYRADNLLSRVLPDQSRLSILLQQLADTDAFGWYFKTISNHLLETFWGRFGWGHIPLAYSDTAYRVLRWVTLLGLIGAGIRCFFNRQVRWETLGFLGIAVLMVAAGALTRGSNNMFASNLYYSSARYFYPVILPVIALLTAGWDGWRSLLSKKIPFSTTALSIAYLLLMLILDGLAIIGIIDFYG